MAQAMDGGWLRDSTTHALVVTGATGIANTFTKAQTIAPDSASATALTLQQPASATASPLKVLHSDGTVLFEQNANGGALRLRMPVGGIQNPGLHIEGYNGGWTFEMDSAATVPFNDLAVAKKLSSIQTITPPGSGTFTMTFGGQTTVATAFNASAATVQTNLQALSTIGSGNVRVKLSGSNYVVIFTGTKAFAAQTAITVSSGSVAQTTTGGGVNDIWYWSNNDEVPPTLGVGLAQPDTTYRQQVLAPGTVYPTMGGLSIPFQTGQTGHNLRAGGIAAGGGLTVDASDRVTVQTSADPGSGNDPTAFKVLTNGAVNLFSVGLVNSSGMVLSTASRFSLGAAATNAMTDTLTIAQSSTTNATIKLRTASQGQLAILANGASAAVTVLTSNASTLALGTNGVQWGLFKTTGDFIVGGGAKATPAEAATTDTAGFLHIPSVNGAPTGVPSTVTGAVPLAYDRANNKIYVYNGAWKASAALA